MFNSNMILSQFYRMHYLTSDNIIVCNDFQDSISILLLVSDTSHRVLNGTNFKGADLKEVYKS